MPDMKYLTPTNIQKAMNEHEKRVIEEGLMRLNMRSHLVVSCAKFRVDFPSACKSACSTKSYRSSYNYSKQSKNVCAGYQARIPRILNRPKSSVFKPNYSILQQILHMQPGIR